MSGLVVLGMGARDQFDYSGEGGTFEQRLGRCYELAAKGVIHLRFTEEQRAKANVPKPVGLVHGSWHGPEAPARINHAWVLLEDGCVWEPITETICYREMFYGYTRATDHEVYDLTQTACNMIGAQHFGPWDDEPWTWQPGFGAEQFPETYPERGESEVPA